MLIFIETQPCTMQVNDTGLATRFSHIFSNNVPTSMKSMNQQKFGEQRRYLLNVYSKRYFGDCVGYARFD